MIPVYLEVGYKMIPRTGANMNEAVWAEMARRAGCDPGDVRLVIAGRHASAGGGVAKAEWAVTSGSKIGVVLVSGMPVGGLKEDSTAVLRPTAEPSGVDAWVVCDDRVRRRYADDNELAAALLAAVSDRLLAEFGGAATSASPAPVTPSGTVGHWGDVAELLAADERKALIESGSPGVRSLPEEPPPPDTPVWEAVAVATAAESRPADVVGLDPAFITIGLPTTEEPDGLPNGADVLVAVLDTGCRATHPAFRHSKLKCVSVVPQNPGGDDTNGHGTWCCGAVCGDTGLTPDVRFSGVAPDVRLLSVAVLTPAGWGTDQMIAAGFRLARMAGAKVVSASIGGSSRMPETETEIRLCLDAGMTVVAAAGNSGPGRDTVDYPGRLPGVITVGACTSATAAGGTVHPAGFTSTGPDVDVMAPGVSLIGPRAAGGYVRLSGTSMATPIVAGCAARLVGALAAAGVDPSKLRDRVTLLVSQSCDPARVHGFSPGRHGDGLLDAAKLLAGQTPEPPPPPADPPVGMTIPVGDADVDSLTDIVRVLMAALNTLAAGGTVVVRPNPPVPEGRAM